MEAAFYIGFVLLFLYLFKEYLMDKDNKREDICDYSTDGYHKWSEYRDYGSGLYYQKRTCLHCHKKELVEI